MSVVNRKNDKTLLVLFSHRKKKRYEVFVQLGKAKLNGLWILWDILRHFLKIHLPE